LDGASWSVLDPLIDAGLLKTLAWLLSSGVRAELESIIPPVTGPAWPVIATGLNPGRLGTFDFYSRRSLEDTALYPVRSHHIRGKALWDLLAKLGYRVGVLNYPMLVPAYETSGWMVSGLGALRAQEWVWPSSLGSELDEAAQPYEIQVYYASPRYENRPEVLLGDLARMLCGRLRALEFLLDKHPVDVVVAVLSVVDSLSHTMWHLWDASHPLHDEYLAATMMPKVRQLWSEVDSGIEKLCQRLASSGHMMVVSDHGFGPNLGVFHVNTWLEKHGYLVRRAGPSRAANRLRGELVSRLAPVLNPLFSKLQGTRAHLALRESVLREIDLRRTRAFSLETSNVCGMVFVNRAYARLHSLDEARFVADTTLSIRQRLREYADQTGLGVDVFAPTELYTGEMTHLAPELLLRVDGFAATVSYRFAPKPYVSCEEHPVATTGTHRQEGILVAYGPRVRRGARLDSVSVLDVAATAFHLLGEPVPAGLDGKVAVDAFLPRFQETMRSCEAGEQSLMVERSSYGTAAELKELERRLRALGYLA
jgi:predicted AlkP superfamily phosphohydrolase/phosphomutase